MLCVSDEGLLIEICQDYGIAYTRKLRLLAEMVQTGHKTAAEVIVMANVLIKDRGKHIAPKVLTDWKTKLSQYGKN